MIGHRGEISNSLFNYDSSLIATASMDQTAKLWDSRTGQVVATLRGHEDEVLDITFDYTGLNLATASADGTCYTVDPPNKGHTGDNINSLVLSFVERLSSSWRL